LDAYQFDFKLAARFSQDTSSPNPITIAGVDEAGRGPLAGPVVVAAVILPPEPFLYGLRDSKLIPPEQREALYCEIQETAIALQVAVIDPSIIDQMNILGATLHGMRSAIQALELKPDIVLVDGNKKPESGLVEQAIIEGDNLSASIMAASIIAKVTRDHIMLEAHTLYPSYGFDEHKGYGCEKHLDALKKYGPCPIHRRSFDPVKSLAPLPAGEPWIPR
jgi:ribonuclease HII